MTDAPVYVLIHPDGRVEWGHRKAAAERQLGPHGVGSGWLTDASLGLRLSMSDCAAIMPEVYAPNPFAVEVLARVAGLPQQMVEAAHLRGPVALWGWDPANEWDSTRPFTAAEWESIRQAVDAAGCTAV